MRNRFLKPQASSLKPQASKNSLKILFFVCQAFFQWNVAFAADPYTPSAQELQALSSTQDIKYAFFREDSKSVWFIVGASSRPNEAYFLAPFLNGQPGWGIIGGASRISVATVNLNANTVQINSGISANSPASGFQDAANNALRTERNARDYAQLVEGKSFNIGFYFFQVGTAWYITHPQTNKVHKFVSNVGATDYDWAEVLAPNGGSWKATLSGSSFSLTPIAPVTDLPRVDEGGSELGSKQGTSAYYQLPTVDKGVFPVIVAAVIQDKIAQQGYSPAEAFKNVCTFDDPEFSNVNQSSWSVPYVNGLCSACIVVGYKEGNLRLYKPLQAASLGEVMKVLTATNDYSALERCEPLEPSRTALNPSSSDIRNYWNCYFTEAQSKGLSVDVNNYGLRPVRRGTGMQYVVNLFYRQSMTEQNAASFLASKGIIDYQADYALGADLLRDQLAKMGLKAAQKTNKGLPYNLCSRPKTLPQSDMPPDAAPELSGSNIGSAAFDNSMSFIGTKSGRGLIWAKDGITYCQVFVRSMFGLPASGDAIDVCNRYQRFGLIKTSGTPTKGAAICYGAVSGNKYGHISIARGDGNEVGVRYASRGVELSATPAAQGYMGWIDAQDFVSNYSRK